MLFVKIPQGMSLLISSFMFDRNGLFKYVTQVMAQDYERRIPAENGASEIEQKDRRTKDWSEILHKMILGPNTLKAHFEPIILSFVILSHGLRYVPEKPISIKHEY